MISGKFNYHLQKGKITIMSCTLTPQRFFTVFTVSAINDRLAKRVALVETSFWAAAKIVEPIGSQHRLVLNGPGDFLQRYSDFSGVTAGVISPFASL